MTSDWLFDQYYAEVRRRLNTGDFQQGELDWAVRRMTALVHKYEGQQSPKCALLAHRLHLACGVDCNCTGEAINRILQPYFTRYRVTSPLGGGR